MADHPQDLLSDADPNAMPLDTAVAAIVSCLVPVDGNEEVSTTDALGRVAYCDVVAAIDVPPFRASAMDGYAFRHGDIEQAADSVLHVAGRSLAGHPGVDALALGHCQRITTGARVPDDADTVIQQEDTTELADRRIRLDQLPPRGEFVRDTGSDNRAGSLLVAAGQPLRGADLAICAAHGVGTINVRRRVKVGILSTGDELVEPTGIRARGQIHDANRVLLHALLARPSMEIHDLGIVADTPEAVAACAQSAHAELALDALVSSGGVSVGDADHVRDVLGADGQVQLWKIAMKPGRPLAFGRLASGIAWFGLPGNPVSAAITTLKVLEPALATLCGYTFIPPRPHTARLTQAIAKRPGRVEFQRGVMTQAADGNWEVESVGAQDSHRLQSVQRANCLIELPVGCAGLEAGTRVQVTLLEDEANGRL